MNLFSALGTYPSTGSAVARSAFIFNCTLDAKPFEILHFTGGRAKTCAKFQLKSYEDVLELFEPFFKHHKVFPLTLAVSNIYDNHIYMINI